MRFSFVLFCCLIACTPEKPLHRNSARRDALSSGVVISEVYGGGATGTSTYRYDFIELFNRGTTAVNVSNWSVQYASDTGGGWQVTSLGAFGMLAPGKSLLVRMGAAGTVGQSLPPHDVSGGSAMSATAGKVALVNSTTPLSGTCPAASSYVDLVGYGTTANCSEGAPTGNTSATTSVSRIGNGCTETDSNVNDFTVSGPLPRNNAAQAIPCGSAPVCTPITFTSSASTGGYSMPDQTAYGELSQLNADGGTDLLTLEAYFGFMLTLPATENFSASSLYDFCEVCPTLSRGCDSSGTCAKEYFAQSGSGTVTVATRDPITGNFSGSITQMQFVEWDFMADAPLPGGDCVTLSAQTVTASWSTPTGGGGGATGGGGGAATGGGGGSVTGGGGGSVTGGGGGSVTGGGGGSGTGGGGGSVTGGGGGSVTGGGGGSVTGGGGGSVTGGGGGAVTGGGAGGGATGGGSGGGITGGGSGGGAAAGGGAGGGSGADAGTDQMDAGTGGGGGSGKLGGMSGCGCTTGGESALAFMLFALLLRRRSA